jgi:hypothetical protein
LAKERSQRQEKATMRENLSTHYLEAEENVYVEQIRLGHDLVGHWWGRVQVQQLRRIAWRAAVGAHLKRALVRTTTSKGLQAHMHGATLTPPTLVE